MVVLVSQVATSSVKSGILTAHRRRLLAAGGNCSGGHHVGCFGRRSFVAGGYKSFRDRRREALPKKTSSSSNMWGGVVVSALTILGGAASAVIMARTEGLEQTPPCSEHSNFKVQRKA